MSAAPQVPKGSLTRSESSYPLILEYKRYKLSEPYHSSVVDQKIRPYSPALCNHDCSRFGNIPAYKITLTIQISSNIFRSRTRRSSQTTTIDQLITRIYLWGIRSYHGELSAESLRFLTHNFENLREIIDSCWRRQYGLYSPNNRAREFYLRSRRVRYSIIGSISPRLQRSPIWPHKAK